MERQRFIYADFPEMQMYAERKGFSENIFTGFEFSTSEDGETYEFGECAWFIRSEWIGLPHRGSFVVLEWPESQEYMDLEGFSDNAYLINDEQGLTEFGNVAYFVNIDWIEEQEKNKQ